MARKVFFSFHHGGDSRRIGVVRNHGVTKDDYQEAGYIDSADWEKIKLQGKDATEKWINDQLNGTSVTVVLIGSKTSERYWVNYEIEESLKRGNALLGVYIHNIKGLEQATALKGNNPFNRFLIEETKQKLGDVISTYDWINDDGYNNFSKWVELACTDLKRYLNLNISNLGLPNVEKSLNNSSNIVSTAIRDVGEQFIEDSGVKINLIYEVEIDCEVKQDGFRPFFLRSTKYFLKKKRSLDFFIKSCNVPHPFSVKWKIKNTGNEAKSLKALRGEIINDAGFGRRKENTLYTGTHYVECYVIKDNYCVDKDRIDVPITSV